MIAEDDPEQKIEPDDVEQFGFHFPFGYVSQICWVLEASSFTYWPVAGGLDDQNADLVADVMTWFRLMRRLRWEYEHGVWETPGERPQEPRLNPLDGRSELNE